MAGVKRLLNAGAIGVAALLLAFSLAALPQAAFAEEAEGAAGESIVSVSDDSAAIDESQNAEYAVNVDVADAVVVDGDGEDAVESDVDESAAEGSAIEGDSDGAEAADAEDATTCHPEQASEASASKDLDTADPSAESVQAASEDTETVQGYWVVSDLGNGYGLQRYWYVGSTYVTSRLVDPREGSGYYAYATKYGYVVRGIYDAGNGYVYLADNDGKLEEASGWLVTGAYTNGALQRYYIDSETHAAKSSYFTVEGYGNCFGIGGKGYVLRGAGSGYNSKSVWSSLYADNDGKLATSKWVCTDAFGQGFQRYWFDSTSAMAKGRLVAKDEGAGYYAYATSNGYVLRGTLDSGAGYVYLADNDGRLASGTANDWLVTDEYAGSLQRYYLIALPGNASVLVAKTSGFEVGSNHYYGQANVGYVLRGKLRYGDGMLLADNDGVLAWIEGWLVTDKYDGEMQRYRIDSAPGNGLMGAHVGYFELGGSAYCGREDQGYVYRNVICSVGGKMYSADNDGVLTYLTEESLMLSRINGYSSGTGWLIAVNRATHKVGVFSGSANNWSLQHYFSCVTGASGTPTITGLYRTTGGKKYALSTDSRAIYCTQIYGGYFFHSVLNSTSELGKSLSHGCIRLAWSDANWIYRNIWGGTTVYIYN